MKSIYIFAVLLLSSCLLNAQVGIGTASPNSSAQLDITSTSKGLLPPRIALTGTTDVSTIASPATGLTIYNSTTTSDVTPGYYYYNGSAWTKLITGIKNTIDALSQTLSASNSGNIYYTQYAGYPVIPETLPVGFECEIINYSNFTGSLTTLSTVQYYTKTTGWNSGVGVATLNIPSGGTIWLRVITISGTRRYFVSGDYQ
jgi:hypothetical protein